MVKAAGRVKARMRKVVCGEVREVGIKRKLIERHHPLGKVNRKLSRRRHQHLVLTDLRTAPLVGPATHFSGLCLYYIFTTMNENRPAVRAYTPGTRWPV